MGAACTSQRKSIVHTPPPIDNDPDSIYSRIESSKLTRKFDMHGESLSLIPMEVFGAVHVKVLIFNSNQISSIPSQISSLTNLEDLQMFDNKLETLPPQVGALIRVQSLNLSNNSLTSLPREIGSMIMLTEIVAWSNKIEQLPTEIGALPKLSMLDISFNLLASLPSTIGGLTALQELKLAGNNLSVLPSSMGGMSALFTADISSNSLTMIPGELSRCSNLIKLNLRRNKLSRLPDELQGFAHLAELNLQGNQLIDLPPSVCDIPMLKRLILSDNQLTNLPPGLDKLKALNMMLVDGNPLQELSADVFKILTIATLHTNGHLFKELPETLSGSKSLYTLFMCNGLLERMPVRFSAPMDRICKMDLSNNKITSFPEECHGLCNLQDLKLHNNCLSALPVTLSNLTNLNILNIHANRIESLPDIFASTLKLKKLFVGYNKLTALPPSLKLATALLEIHASCNPFCEAPDFLAQLPSLKCLWLADCRLPVEKIFESVSSMTALSVLDLSRNEISQIPESFMSNAKNLAIVDLSDNKMSSLPADMSMCARLKVLDLTLCGLNLEQLSLCHGRLVTLNEHAYDLLREVEAVPKVLGIQVGFSMYMGRRENMEDQVSIINNLRGALSMYAVFDGHDGVATATFLKLNFGKKLKALLETQTPIDALKSCYTEMDVMLKESNISNSGSTSSTILIDEQNIYVANAGDSRAVICRTNGVERITIDHKPYNPDEHTRIRAAGGLVTDDGRISGVLAVSRSFGDLHLQPFVSPEPYVQQFQRSADDEWLVVASDGLWDAVADSQIGDIIRTCESPREAAVKLKDMAFQGESTDNISVIAIKLRVL